MLPGPDQIIACPQCGHLARRPTLSSGNTFHSVQWSDGRLEAPMLPEYPDLTRCRGCRALYWIRDARQVGEVDCWHEDIEDAPQEWQVAERVDEPGLDEYADALEAQMATDRDDELFLRIRYWWLFNDPQREEQSLAERGSGRRKRRNKKVLAISEKHASRMEANLERLAKLLDARKPPERIMKAEIARQTGRLDQAIALLEKCPAGLREYSDQILVFARDGDRVVRPLSD